ncbi:MAG: hypothetical protein FD180_4559 [Planctomycetota bacterium]|nr:MAG: hypothetical protein FD180_4559 [Planctomycetota bacterium]
MALPFQPESDLERAVCADPEWQAGAAWGIPRPGHPEGSVAAHVADVLANIDRLATSPEERAKLRFIAILHDACKYKVDESRARTGDNSHAVLARRLAEKFTSDRELLEIIELHDEAFNSWRAFSQRRVRRAEERIRILLDRLGPALPLFRKFFQADNGVPGKDAAPAVWFEGMIPPGGK